MRKEEPCAICGRDCWVEANSFSYIFYYDCPICGRFGTTIDARFDMSMLSAGERMKLSACTRERSMHGLSDLLLYAGDLGDDTSAGACTVEYALNSIFPRRIEDRFDRALRNLSALTSHPGQSLDITRNEAFPLFFAEYNDTLGFMINAMRDLKYISFDWTNGAMVVSITPGGFSRLQMMRDAGLLGESRQAFVAMWFDKETNEVFDKGIYPASYECGFDALRIDRKEHTNKICDEIIAEIRRSRFVVADFTGQRGGVYFEAGFAMGLGIPVIWMCRSDEVEKLHFDTRQYSHIVWDDPEDLRKKLKDRIAATIPGAKLREFATMGG